MEYHHKTGRFTKNTDGETGFDGNSLDRQSWVMAAMACILWDFYGFPRPTYQINVTNKGTNIWYKYVGLKS